MPRVVRKTFRELDSRACAGLTSPPFHLIQIVVNPMMLEEPSTLTGVLGEHPPLDFEHGSHVHIKSGHSATDGVGEVEVGNRAERRGFGRNARPVVRRRRSKTGIADETTRGL